jgi:hypothetical protein
MRIAKRNYGSATDHRYRHEWRPWLAPISRQCQGVARGGSFDTLQRKSVGITFPRTLI